MGDPVYINTFDSRVSQENATQAIDDKMVFKFSSIPYISMIFWHHPKRHQSIIQTNDITSNIMK